MGGLSNIATTGTGYYDNDSTTPRSFANDRKMMEDKREEFERTEGAAARESSMERERVRDTSGAGMLRTTMRGSPAYNEQKAEMEGVDDTRERDSLTADHEHKNFLDKAKDKIIGVGV